MDLRFTLIKAELSVSGDLKVRMRRGRTDELIRLIFLVLLTTATNHAKEYLKLNERRVARSLKRNART
jgi:hypothetical protein